MRYGQVALLACLSFLPIARGYTATILTQPKSQTVTAPDPASFVVAATGTPSPTYQWQVSLNGTTWSAVESANAATYVTDATKLSDNGKKFRVVVTSGSSKLNSAIATLTVKAAPAITTQPSNATAIAPTKAKFTVVATGNPAPTYQWQVLNTTPGSVWSDVSGATASSYTTPATVLAHSGRQYRVIVKNVIDSVTNSETSATATLTVQTRPVITLQPLNKTVTAPATAQFKVVAAGDPAPTYQWQVLIGTAWTPVSNGTGETTDSYTTAATNLTDNGKKYRVVLIGAGLPVTSSIVTLTVKVAAAITGDPEDKTIVAPATAKFTVVATGNPAPTYQWQVLNTTPGSAWSNVSGGTASSYTTPATLLAHSGRQYRVIVKNVIDSITNSETSAAATLTVQTRPVITLQPVSRTVTAPAPVEFKIAATGVPSPTYQWQVLNGASWSDLIGETASTYSIAEPGLSDNAKKFRVVLTGAGLPVTSSIATLTVKVAATITGDPEDRTVTAPATAKFTVIAKGNPAPTYQWQLSMNAGTTWTNVGGGTGSSYTTPATALAQNGRMYRVIVKNVINSVTSTPVTLTVQAKPVITTQPVNRTVTAGGTASFTVAATGNPTPTFSWERSDNGGTSWVALDLATLDTYAFTAQITDLGAKFRAKVTNSLSTLTSNIVTLTVLSDPSADPIINAFTATPTTLLQGDQASFRAVFANGTGRIEPGSWPIVSGTPVLITPAASQTYTLTVTNAGLKTVQSDVALTVLPPYRAAGGITSAEGALGTLSLRFAAPTKHPAASVLGAGGGALAQGILVLSGATTPLTGTFTPAAGALVLSGGPYSFEGTAAFSGDTLGSVSGALTTAGSVISGPTTTLPAVLATQLTVAPTAALPGSRAGHTATTLPDGRILIVGGDMETDGVDTTHDALVWDPDTRVFSPTGQMPDGSRYHHRVAVHNGKVWIFGGHKATPSSGVTAIATVECWDPSLNGGVGAFVTKTSLLHARTCFTLVQDGPKVYLLGGYGATNMPISSIEEYDLTGNGGNGSTLDVGTLLHPRYDMVGGQLSDGRILLMGGFTGQRLKDFTKRVASLTDSTEWFDPTTRHSTTGPKLLKPQGGEGGECFRLGDRLLLMPAIEKIGTTTYAATRNCYWFDQAALAGAGAFTLGPLTNSPRVAGAGIGQLLDGSIVYAGGFNAAFNSATGVFSVSEMLKSVEVLGPMDAQGDMGAWQLLPTQLSTVNMNFSYHGGTVSLRTGEFLVCGGSPDGGETYTSSADVVSAQEVGP